MVTIAIPFYNSSEYLDRAIRSVICQTYKDWKLILIDDGSTDTSAEIASRYTIDPRIMLISDGIHKNLSYRLNELAMMTDTKYLARMDADDIMHPSRIEKQLNTMEGNPQIDVLGTNAYSIDEHDLIRGIRFNYSEITLQKVETFIHPSIIAKTKWFIENPYDPLATRIEDVDLWYRTSKKYNFQILTEPLLFYRELSDSYYKKYFKGLPSAFYLLKKYSFNTNLFFFYMKYVLSGFICFVFYVFRIEHLYLKRRNAIILNSLPLQHFLEQP